MLWLLYYIKVYLGYMPMVFGKQNCNKYPSCLLIEHGVTTPYNLNKFIIIKSMQLQTFLFADVYINGWNTFIFMVAQAT